MTKPSKARLRDLRDRRGVSIHLPVELVRWLDEQAKLSSRSRTGQIEYLLNLIQQQQEK